MALILPGVSGHHCTNISCAEMCYHIKVWASGLHNLEESEIFPLASSTSAHWLYPSTWGPLSENWEYTLFRMLEMYKWDSGVSSRKGSGAHVTSFQICTACVGDIFALNILQAKMITISLLSGLKWFLNKVSQTIWITSLPQSTLLVCDAFWHIFAWTHKSHSKTTLPGKWEIYKIPS